MLATSCWHCPVVPLHPTSATNFIVDVEFGASRTFARLTIDTEEPAGIAGPGEACGVGDGAGVGDGVGVDDGVGVGLGVGVDDGVGVAVGVGVGVGIGIGPLRWANNWSMSTPTSLPSLAFR